LPLIARSEARAANPRGLRQQLTRVQLTRAQVRTSTTSPWLQRALSALGAVSPPLRYNMSVFRHHVGEDDSTTTVQPGEAPSSPVLLHVCCG
jgi:hypothetical protein